MYDLIFGRSLIVIFTIWDFFKQIQSYLKPLVQKERKNYHQSGKT
jgi:hypothetical protein